MILSFIAGTVIGGTLVCFGMLVALDKALEMDQITKENKALRKIIEDWRSS